MIRPTHVRRPARIRSFTGRALPVLLSTMLLVLCGWTAAGAAAPGLTDVVAGLERSRVYIDPGATSPRIDAARLLAVTPAGTYFTSLSAATLASTDAAEVPALLSNRVGRGGTFIVLRDGKLYGASTTSPGRLGGELAAAQAALPTGKDADATSALSVLMRSLAGTGNVQDTQSPSRAGSPVSSALLVGLLLALLAGGAALWWRLRRKPGRPRRRSRPAAPPRDLVEIDHAGRIIRRVPGSERET